jgi:hypothetical protein
MAIQQHDNDDPLAGRLNIPQRKAFAIIGVGRNKGRELIAKGILETLSLGERSNPVTVESIRRLQRNGIPSSS